MDCDLNKWLKDDLGLRTMSEADLYGIIYHPRHGSTCRKFLRFLADSVVCKRKYPDVYVREDYELALEDFDKRNEELEEVKRELIKLAEQYDNDQLEASFLEKKLEHMKKIELLIRSSTEAMEEIVRRPKVGIERIAEIIDNCDYLNYKEHEKLYSKSNFSTENIKVENSDEDIRATTDSIEDIHAAITDLYKSIQAKLSEVKAELRPNDIVITNLDALKLPEVQEVVEDPESDAQRLMQTNAELCDRIRNLDQQVMELKHQFYSRIELAELAASEQMAEYQQISDELQELEEAIDAIST